MPRVTPVSDRSQVAPEHQEIVDSVLKVFGQLRGPHSILLLSPKADEPVLNLGNYFRYDSIVKSPLKELAIITGVRERDALYVWAAQTDAGRRNGLSEEAITVVRERRDPSTLPPEQAEVVTYVRQLCRNNRVDQAAFDALKNRHGVQWLVEMTTVVGYYSMLGGVVNAFEVDPPQGGERLPVP
jgi:4-carboxymuconolactone decarboxylase